MYYTALHCTLLYYTALHCTLFYRSRKEREEQRAKQGGKTTASDWMRKSGATTVVNVSATKYNKLALAIEQARTSCPAPKDTRTKVQERPGRSVRQILVRVNPLPQGHLWKEILPLGGEGGAVQRSLLRRALYVVFAPKPDGLAALK